MLPEDNESNKDFKSKVSEARKKRRQYFFKEPTGKKRGLNKQSSRNIKETVFVDLCELPTSPPSTSSTAADAVSKQFVIELETANSYAHLLIENKATIITRWIVALARRSHSGINLSSFVAVIKVNGQLYCSCDSQHLEISLTCKAQSVYPPDPVDCEHLAVLRLFPDDEIAGLDEWVPPSERRGNDHSYSPPTDYQSIDVAAETVLIYHNRRFATVSRRKCDCENHVGPCPYLKLYGETADPDEFISTKNSRQTSLSWKPISFFPTSCPPNVTSILQPKECSKCKSRDLQLSVEYDDIPLYTRYHMHKVSVWSSTCDSCDEVCYPDGGDVGVLNMSNFLVSHELLSDYCTLFVSEGLPLYAYYKTCAWKWLNQETPLSYAKFRLAWLAYLDLLDYHSPQQDAFSCHLCGLQPDIIICDGITLSFQRRFLQITSQDENSPILKGSRYNERVAVGNTELRRLLRSTTITKRTIDLAEKEAPWLLKLLHYVQENGIEDCPSEWRQLLRDLGANTAVIGMFDTSVEPLDIKLETVKDIECAAKGCPSIYNILRQNKDHIDLLKPILAHLQSKCEYIKTFKQHHREPAAADSTCTLSGFPALPKIFGRGRFEKDAEKTSKVCMKSSSRHKSLIPGIFTINCPHGVCYGFEIMRNFESANVPFTLIRTRFEKAPSLIIYDNACNLHDYCLNRDPAFFITTKFCVDRFHWYNHKDCSSGYNIRMFPQYNSINTQVAEQNNAALANLRSMLSYTNMENFNQLLRLFLWFRNTVHLLKMRPPTNPIESSIKKLFPVYVKNNY